MKDKQKEYDEITSSLLNNQIIAVNLLKYNKKFEIKNYKFLYGNHFPEEVYFLVQKLGVPIGVHIMLDENNVNIYDLEEGEKSLDEFRHFYYPILEAEDYFNYLSQGQAYNSSLMVCPNYMTQEEAMNILYCIEHCNNKEIFDYETMDKMQYELIDSVPLNYNETMKIFRKYYTNEVCEYIINKWNIDKDWFYELSGLDKFDEVELNF